MRKYTRHEPEPEVMLLPVQPEPITYKFGTCFMTLTGFYAYLYRGMVMMYGEEEAPERFWYLFHKKNSVICQENAVSAQLSLF